MLTRLVHLWLTGASASELCNGFPMENGACVCGKPYSGTRCQYKGRCLVLRLQIRTIALLKMNSFSKQLKQSVQNLNETLFMHRLK